MTVVSAAEEGTIARAIAMVQGGRLVVIPTDTSYAVIADAFHAGAIT
ncbi:MAG: threonylcarbamoyl-AMP synthase, partial [Actinomycetes bacterium]